MTTFLPSLPKANTDLQRVGILFSGGPAPAADAVIAGAASCFSRAGIEVVGIRSGYSHLMDYRPGDELREGIAYAKLDHRTLDGERVRQDIIIGTARANPGKKVKKREDFQNPERTAPLNTVYEALRSIGVDALISIGGDDTLTTAAKFQMFQDTLPAGKKRIRVVHLPKTIDNDYEGIDFTFGYFSAVEMLATQIRNLLADSMSTGTYYIAQVMGRAAGWLAYGAAIAGEASLVVGLEDLPGAYEVMELGTIPDDADWDGADWWELEPVKDPDSDDYLRDKETNQIIKRPVVKAEKVRTIAEYIVDVIQAREEEGQDFGVVVMAEGIAEYLPMSELENCLSNEEFARLRPDDFGHFPVSQLKFSGRIGRLVIDEYQQRTGKKRRVNGLQFGYEVRCHRPTAFDVALGSQLGVGAYRALAEEGKDGVMISVTGQLGLVFEPFENLIDLKKLRAHARPIKRDEDFHKLARYLQVRV